MQLETELKYFIAAKDLEAEIVLESYDNITIFQAYFSDEQIVDLLLPLLNLGSELSLKDFKNGRIRCSQSKAGCKYYVTVKGPMQENFSRVEIEREIDQKTYEKLLQQHSKGNLEKTRYYIPGIFISKNVELIAEVDLLKNVNNCKIEEEFYTIDVELPDYISKDQFLVGENSFKFLKKAILLSGTELNLRKLLGMRYLANNGYQQKTKMVVVSALAGNVY